MTAPLWGFLLVLAGSAAAWALTRRGHRAAGSLVLVVTVAGLVIAAMVDPAAASMWIIGGVAGAAIAYAFMWRKQHRTGVH